MESCYNNICSIIEYILNVQQCNDKSYITVYCANCSNINKLKYKQHI